MRRLRLSATNLKFLERSVHDWCGLSQQCQDRLLTVSESDIYDIARLKEGRKVALLPNHIFPIQAVYYD